jgi:hypothetical protein
MSEGEPEREDEVSTRGDDGHNAHSSINRAVLVPTPVTDPH